MSTPLTGDQLADAGRCLFGDEHWMGPLCKALRISDRTLRRTLNGEIPPPAGFRGELVKMLHERQTHIATLLKAIDTGRPF